MVPKPTGKGSPARFIATVALHVHRTACIAPLAASALASDRLFAATFPGHSEATFSKVLAASGDAELAHRG